MHLVKVKVKCAFDKISNRQCHFRSEIGYSEVDSEPKHEVATIERELGSLITVPLHSMSSK